VDGLITLLVLVALAIPIVAVVAIAVAVGAKGRVNLLEARLRALEQRLAQGEAAAPAVPPPAVAPAPEPAAAAIPPVAEPAGAVAEPAPAAAPEPAQLPPSPPPAAPPPEGPSFEERFGTQWVVWVGGLALALGGIFLVRYSIEQGLLGPGVRVFLGALLAAALIAGGEWARRTERLAGLANLPTAHIPSILTAAGTTVAYATVYAAYGLYGFLSPAAAFVLLAVVALLTLAAALLHGPALAGLGLVGAYMTPLLVSADEPNYWALYLYLAVVSAASFALARMRLWRWLAITAVAFGTLWMFPGIDGMATDVLLPHAFHAVVGFALAAVLIVCGFLYGPPAEPGRIDAVSSAALAAYLFAAAMLVFATRHDAVALAAFTLLAAGTVAIAWRTEAAVAAVPAAAALAVLVLADWAVDLHIEHLVAPGGPVAGTVAEPAQAAFGPHLALGGALALLFGGAGFLAQGRSERPIAPVLWAASGVIAPLAILVALYGRIAAYDRSIPFAILALVLTGLYAWAVENFDRRAPRPGLAAAGAIHAAGAIAALALALTFSLEKGWLTVGLALMVPGIAWVAEKRPLPLLRWAAAFGVTLVLARIGWEPRIVGGDVGTTPIFNWLLYGYGVPAAAFWLAGHLLRRRGDDVPTRTVEAGAILFTVLLAFLEIRHFMNGGDVYRRAGGLGEVALQVSVALAMAIGLERLRARSGSIVHDLGALALAALALAGIVFGLWLAENPLMTAERVGGRFVNLILLGYALPAVLAAILALVARGTRPYAYRVVAAVAAVGLALAYLSLEVTRLYHGPVLTAGPTSNAEQYTYSAVWLAFGVALLIAGVLLRSQPARMASAAVVLITIAKVFLLDLAVLEGPFRALSFIGLGLVLVGIGWLYQRLLFPRRAAAAAPVASPP
jgi:uncharacterized membrane protein